MMLATITMRRVSEKKSVLEKWSASTKSQLTSLKLKELDLATFDKLLKANSGYAYERLRYAKSYGTRLLQIVKRGLPGQERVVMYLQCGDKRAVPATILKHLNDCIRLR